MNLNAVVFDLDGVITDTAHLHFLAWRAVAKEVGITIDEAFNETLKGISRMDSLQRILRHGGKEDAFDEQQRLALARKKMRTMSSRWLRLRKRHCSRAFVRCWPTYARQTSKLGWRLFHSTLPAFCRRWGSTGRLISVPMRPVLPAPNRTRKSSLPPARVLTSSRRRPSGLRMPPPALRRSTPQGCCRWE